MGSKYEAELLERELGPSRVSRRSFLSRSSLDYSSVKSAILRKAQPTITIQVDTPDSLSFEGLGSLPVPQWESVISDTWSRLPLKAQIVADSLVDKVVVVYPSDSRLEYATVPRAMLYDDMIILPHNAEPEEIWHEVGHIVTERGLTPDEAGVLQEHYDFSRESLPPLELLAEDFYFHVKGDKVSPFWKWWLGGESVMATKVKRSADKPGSLDIVQGALEQLADLIFEYGVEEDVMVFGMAMEALTDAQKEDRLAQEDRVGDHQYYYPEDLDSPESPGRKDPLNQPLEVDSPDVTIRQTRDQGQGTAGF